MDAAVTVYDSGPVSVGTPISYSGVSPYSIIGINANGAVLIDNILIGTLAAPSTPAGPPRLNGTNWGAPVALFCTAGGGLDIYRIVGDQGVLAARLDAQTIANGLALATSQGSNVQILNTGTLDVWVLASGEVQVNDGEYAYRLVYQGACGALPAPDLASSAEIEDEAERGVIISRPR
jgi:hypothetical protein